MHVTANSGYFRVNLPASSQQPASLSRKPTRPLTPNDIKMAAFFKAVNAKIRANPMLSYVCSTRTFASQSDFPRFDSYSLDSGWTQGRNLFANWDWWVSQFRFLGSSIELRYPGCGSHGYAEEPWVVSSLFCELYPSYLNYYSLHFRCSRYMFPASPKTYS